MSVFGEASLDANPGDCDITLDPAAGDLGGLLHL